MWSELFLASLWGGVVAMDTTAAFQAMISRPMVSCTVIGLILGNVQLGFTIGIILELLYISELPVGAAKFAEGNVGAASAATIAIIAFDQMPDRSLAILSISLLLAVLISSCGGRLVVLMRRINSRIYSRLLEKDPLTPWHIDFAQFWGIAQAFVIGFSCVFLTSLFFVESITRVLYLVPETYDKILQPATVALLGAGCAFLAHMFWQQNKRGWLFVLGLAVTLVSLFVI